MKPQACPRPYGFSSRSSRGHFFPPASAAPVSNLPMMVITGCSRTQKSARRPRRTRAQIRRRPDVARFLRVAAVEYAEKFSHGRQPVSGRSPRAKIRCLRSRSCPEMHRA
jgi:hypothetical protein